MRTTNYSLALIINYLLIIPASSFAMTTEITCPASIDTNQQIKNTPSGFASRSSEQTHYLDHITFYSGEPKQNASLAPDKTQKAKLTWIFQKNEMIYLGCSYNQTDIELYKPLTAMTKKCIVTYDLLTMGSAGPLPIKITCEL